MTGPGSSTPGEAMTQGRSDSPDKTSAVAAPNIRNGATPIVITGGSGFIGSNLADSYLRDGEDVIILDNLNRPGVDQNLAWLKERYPHRVHAAIADVRNLGEIEPAFDDAKAVFHLAAQTAVTTSLAAPLGDVEANARGTINVLEAVRKAGRRAPVIFASTNKVYGALEDIEMLELEDRYVPASDRIRASGIGEDRPLQFCTPYGCSKGVADQYVLDYANSYGIPTAVLRMSCIYGPRQFGTEDQGWVAHFLIKALQDEPVSIYGDGKQVRDILHVEDAVAAYRAVHAQIGEVRSDVFNLGGGSGNSVSLLEVLREIESITGRPLKTSFGDWRAGDQLFFVADTQKLQKRLGWQSRIRWRSGLRHLAEWLAENRFAGDAVLPQKRKASA